MPTLQGFKFSFIHDFRKENNILVNGSIFLSEPPKNTKPASLTALPAISDEI